MLIKLGNWFEMEVAIGVLALVRVGLLAVGVASTDKPKSYFDAYREGKSIYLYGLGREVLVSANG